MLKSASFVFGALLLSGLAASTAPAQEAVRNMLAAQIRTQGYVCDKTVKSVKDVKRSRPDHEVWVLTWPVNTTTALHDHGTSRGAFRVIRGALVEQLPVDGVLRRSVVPTGDTRTFGTDHVHDVGNPFGSTAISVHAYSPPLQTQRYYDYRGGDLVEIAEVPADDRLSTAVNDPREEAA